jgi:hypothetical protein
VGHTDPSVNDKYGAKNKAIRFRHRLAEAVASVTYAGTGPIAFDMGLHGADGHRTPRNSEPQGRRAVTNDDGSSVH